VPKKATLSIQIDSLLKRKVEEIFCRYGLTLSDAVIMFLYQSITVDGLPFGMRSSKPNAETEEAINEAVEILKHVKSTGNGRFDSVEVMFAELKN
jgi:DNA-damage-inducible protein J